MEPAQFLDDSGSKKAPDIRTTYGSGLSPIADVKTTSTSATAPALDLRVQYVGSGSGSASLIKRASNIYPTWAKTLETCY